jgi:hypothetical protein
VRSSTFRFVHTIAKIFDPDKLLEDLLDSNVPPHRAFPLEAIVLFPLLGPPALALLGATLYAAMLMIFLLSPGAILALPVYFFFWASMAYAALWPAAAAGGVLYALAVRFFAPPVVVTAMIAGAIGAVGYGIALILLGLAPFGNLPDGSGISLGKGHSQTVVLGAIIGVAQAVPGWWASRKMRAWLATRQRSGKVDE